MPPKTPHTVYTPTASFTWGGHFYCYDSMHYTEHACQIDKKNWGITTNEYHEHTLSGQKVYLLWLAGYGLYWVITVFVGGEENYKERFMFRIPKVPVRLLELAKFLYSELNQR